MSFEFRALSHPFPRWFGPYSPACGTTSGLRIQLGVLGTYVTTPTGQQRWVAHQCAGVQQLQTLVVSRWGGGRVLLMPNGWVIKPDPTGNGIRWAIGRFSGPLILQRGDGTFFNMASPGALTPGMHWLGPDTTGLECTLDNTGAIQARSTIPTAFGEIITEIPLVPRDAQLARGLALARPGCGRARVRVTENGHVITKRDEAASGWTSVYVGFIDPSRWPHDEEWVESAVPQAPQLQFDVSVSDDEEIEDEFEDEADDYELESAEVAVDGAADVDSPAAPGTQSPGGLGARLKSALLEFWCRLQRLWCRMKSCLVAFLGGT